MEKWKKPTNVLRGDRHSFTHANISDLIVHVDCFLLFAFCFLSDRANTVNLGFINFSTAFDANAIFAYFDVGKSKRNLLRKVSSNKIILFQSSNSLLDTVSSKA